jgi:hypothetical protein
MKNNFQIPAGAIPCKKCGSPLGPFSANAEDVLLRCERCNAVFEEHRGDAMEVMLEYAMPPSSGKSYINLPFWQFLPDIKIFRRSIEKKSFLDAPVNTLKNRLYSPAFNFKDIKVVINLCAFFTMNNPRYKLSAPYKFECCAYNHFQSQRIARSIFLLIEAQDKDKIFGMDYELLLEAPKLVILPFEVKGDKLSSPFIHIEIPQKAIG